jgi:DNA-binding NarL/FixJ family response regulator
LSTRSNAAHLTARQLEILELLTQGLRNSEIADRLYLSGRTVDHHVSAILDKLGARSRTEASQQAARLGIHPSQDRQTATPT